MGVEPAPPPVIPLTYALAQEQIAPPQPLPLATSIGATMRVMTPLSLLAVGTTTLAAQAPDFTDEVRQYVSVDAPAVALTHVKVIDGMGSPAAADQVVLIEGGRIRAVGPVGSVTIPAGAERDGVLNRESRHIQFTAGDRRHAASKVE